MFARVIGALLIVLAVVLNAILIPSGLHRLVRLSAVPFWLAGFYILLIEGRGVSIKLYINHKRQLHPWERMADTECAQPEVKAERTGSHNPHNLTESADLVPQETAAQVDLSKSESFQALGPTNEFGREDWVELYREKSVWQKIFDVSVPNHNKHLRVLQDRIIWTALIWAGFLAIVLTLVSVLIPSGNLF